MELRLLLPAFVLIIALGIPLTFSGLLDNITYVNSTCVTFIAQKIELLNTKASSPLILPPQQQQNSSGSPCTETTSTMTLSYPRMGEIASMSFSLTFSKDRQNWVLSGTAVEIKCQSGASTCTAVSEGYLESASVSANLGMSFKCLNPPLMKIRDPTGKATPLSLRFTWLQVQPFGSGTGVFGEALDCVRYFTIPIWSTLVVSFLLIGILTYGLGMLAAVKPYDLYDDPKGKMIQLGALN